MSDVDIASIVFLVIFFVNLMLAVAKLDNPKVTGADLVPHVAIGLIFLLGLYVINLP